MHELEIHFPWTWVSTLLAEHKMGLHDSLWQLLVWVGFVESNDRHELRFADWGKRKSKYTVQHWYENCHSGKSTKMVFWPRGEILQIGSLLVPGSFVLNYDI